VSRRLARNQRVLVASPAYLASHGAPQELADLAVHHCLTVRENTHHPGQRVDVWHLQRERDKTPAHVRVQGGLSSNSGELVRDWCLAGQGIMLRSLWDIAAPLATGELVRVLPAWSMVDADVHWLAPWQPRTPRRLRLLIDFLADQFRTEPWKNTTPPSVTAGAPRAQPGSRQRL
jgi:DNA-binding transcriptional LysR family regulator